jgi:hypothetical protein
MTHLILQFSTPVILTTGQSFVAAVHGQQAEDGLWDGWIEFDPRDGSEVLRTPRETRQPNQTDLEYWATGLTAAYLEGALERAQNEGSGNSRAADSIVQPPSRAQFTAGDPRTPAGSGGSHHAVLNPFHVYEQGEDVLRKELAALGEEHVRAILVEYHLLPPDQQDPESLGRTAMVGLIVSGVKNSF